MVIEEGSKLRTIGKDACRNCRKLAKLTFPEGLETIGKYIFYDSGIEEIVLPNTLKEIDEYAFRGAPKLKTVWVEAGCTLDIRNYVG